jgi:hypothetical protein
VRGIGEVEAIVMEYGKQEKEIGEIKVKEMERVE